MFDAAGHHEELSLVEFDVAVPQLEGQMAFEHEEEVVGLIVLMPDEFAFDFDQQNVVVVERRDDPWCPMVVEACELFDQVRFGFHRFPFRGTRCGGGGSGSVTWSVWPAQS